MTSASPMLCTRASFDHHLFKPKFDVVTIDLWALFEVWVLIEEYNIIILICTS